MYMADGIDTGDMLLKAECPITDEDNFESIHDRLGALGAQTLLDTIVKIKDGTLIATPQDDALATHAAKIEKADCILDFSDSVRALHCRIRGLSPIPVALTHTPDGKLLKIPDAVPSALPRPVEAQNGEILSLDGGVITVACGDGTLALTRVTPEGKRPMAAADYIRGRNVKVGDVLG
jgi:methionyl-tRNA formyltransferase